MESVILLIISAVVLYHLNQKQDRIAERLIAEAFNRFERRYNNITYSCPDAKVVRKQILGSPSFMLVPSINYTARALCLSEENDWFWFDCNIQNMKICSTGITPCSAKEASEALKDDQETWQQYFPGTKEEKTESEVETSV